MFEAFRVGPVETKQGTFAMYAACSPSGVETVVAADDREGLVELRKRAPTGIRSCEPSLAPVGKALGFSAATLTDDATHLKATLATLLLFGRSVDPRVLPQIPQTIDVAQRFLRERPWQVVRPEIPVEVLVTLAGREHRLVASVLGADGIEFGVALHESAAALARFIDVVRRGRVDEARRIAVRSLTVGSEPAWVADAVRAAFGDPLVVFPTMTDAKGPGVTTSEDLSILATVMFAISKLGPGRLTADATTEVVDGGQCRATARIPDGTAVTSPPLPGWVERPMRITGAVPAALLTVPVLPVSDLRAVVSGLRALGFTVTETGVPRTATALWPGMVLELADAPSARGSGCHIVVEAIAPLIAAWNQIGVELRIVEHGTERIAMVELPGGLTLTFGELLPAGFQPAKKPRRRPPGRRS